MNPSWRNRDESGRLVVGAGGSGPWDTLICPGQNGLISVLACLSWWFEEEHSSDRWREAVSDVLWVLHGIEQSGELR